MGSKTKEYFPNINIVGNWDLKAAGFEVYLRGVGPEESRDDQHR